MKDLKKIAKQSIEELNAIGIYPNITPNDFKATTQYKTWGRCYSTKNKRTNTYSHHITIAKSLLEDNVSENSTRDTVFHELLHACDECYDCGHDGKWKMYADLVSDCYGLNIKESTLSIEKKVDNSPKNIYQCKCERCGKIISKKGYRSPKWYAHPNLYKHNCADGEKGKLIKIENNT